MKMMMLRNSKILGWTFPCILTLKWKNKDLNNMEIIPIQFAVKIKQ